MAVLRPLRPTAAVALAWSLSPFTGLCRRTDDDAHIMDALGMAARDAKASPVDRAVRLGVASHAAPPSQGSLLETAAAEQRGGARFPFGKRWAQLAPLAPSSRPHGAPSDAVAAEVAARLGSGRHGAGGGAGIRSAAHGWDEEESDGSRYQPEPFIGRDRGEVDEELRGSLKRMFEDEYRKYLDSAPAEAQMAEYAAWLGQEDGVLEEAEEQAEELSPEALDRLAESILQELAFTSAPPSTARRWPEVWTEVVALDRKGMRTWVQVPKEWAGLLAVGQLREVNWGSALGTRFVAPYADDPRRRLAVKVTNSHLEDAHHEMQVLQLLRSSGNMLALLGRREFARKAFLLTPAADMSLAQFLASSKSSGAEQLPFERSLRILIDLLRAARDLDEAGVVHSAIAADTVVMQSGRPLLADFRHAAIVSEADAHLGRQDTSVFHAPWRHRFPPETIRGIATGASNNVWQVGLVFAQMCAGADPIASAVASLAPDISTIVPWDPKIVDRTQDVVRRLWSPQRDPHIQGVGDEDARRLLEGLLETSLERRWTAAGALAEALAVAGRRGVEVPPERAPPEALHAAHSDWQ